MSRGTRLSRFRFLTMAYKVRICARPYVDRDMHVGLHVREYLRLYKKIDLLFHSRLFCLPPTTGFSSVRFDPCGLICRPIWPREAWEARAVARAAALLRSPCVCSSLQRMRGDRRQATGLHAGRGRTWGPCVCASGGRRRMLPRASAE